LKIPQADLDKLIRWLKNHKADVLSSWQKHFAGN